MHIDQYLGSKRKRKFYNIFFRKILRFCHANPLLFTYTYNVMSKIYCFDNKLLYENGLYKFIHYYGVSFFYDINVFFLHFPFGAEYRFKYSLAKAYHIEKIKFLPDDIIIDCGANHGEFYYALLSMGISDIKYIPIEPSKREYECLITSTNPKESYNIGLWNKNEILEFHYARHGLDSSLIVPPNSTEKVKVTVKRLDSILQYPKIKLLKLEAEGAEPEIIQGCQNILQNIEYISADLGPERGKNQESTLPQVVNYLLNNNFEILACNVDRLCVLFKNKNFVS